MAKLLDALAQWFVVVAVTYGCGLVYADELSECRRLAPLYGAECEVLMPDDTRCDLLTNTEAIEVDWSPKWKEAVGQSLLYAIWTGRRPAVLLLVKNPDDEKANLLRAKLVCERAGIALHAENVTTGKPLTWGRLDSRAPDAKIGPAGQGNSNGEGKESRFREAESGQSGGRA